MFKIKKNKSPFPVVATALTAYRDIFGNPAQFFRMVLFTWLLMFALIDVPTHFISKDIAASIEAQKKVHAAVVKATTPPDASNDEVNEAAKALGLPAQPEIKISYIIISFALNMLQVAIVFAFAVALYRRFLRGEKDKIILFRFGKMEREYFLTSIKAGFVLLPILILNIGLMFSLMPGGAPPGSPPPGAETLAFIVIGLLASLYLQARLSMAYPLNVMGELQEPIKRSFKLTGRYGVQIAVGNVIVVLPIMLLTVLFIYAATTATDQLLALPEAPLPGSAEPEIPLAVTLFLKAMGSLFTITTFAVLTAFHSRIYTALTRLPAE